MDRRPSLRVGAAERDHAIEALSEHMAAERLTTGEFVVRMELAQEASSESDLRVLFEDLPAPRWDGTGGEVLPAPASRLPQEAVDAVPGEQVAGRSGRRAAVVANAMFPVSGVLALALSAATGSWEWFLVVPPAFYGIREVTRKLWPIQRAEQVRKKEARLVARNAGAGSAQSD
jgi:hypothetical protein